MSNNIIENNYDDLYLGNGAHGIYSTDPSVSKTNNNVLIFAGTNRGKTTSIVEPYLLHVNHSSMAIMLTKRRLLDQYAPLLHRRGYDIQIIDLVRPARSTVGFDPMLHVKDDISLTGLSKALVEGIASTKEPYWHTSASNLFKALAKLAQYLCGGHATMEMVYDMAMEIKHSSFYDPDRVREEEFDIPIEFAKRKLKDPEMYGNWTQFFLNADNTGACILSETKSVLNEVFPKDIRAFMSLTPQLDIPSLVKKRTCLFVITSPVNPALHPFANILFSIIFRELFEFAENQPSGKLPRPFTAICDDFATGSKIPDFQHYLSIFREKGISAIMLVQSLSQLKAIYGGENASTIIDNVDNLVYLGGMDTDTAREVSLRADKPLQEILTMEIGREYLFRSGQEPLYLQRYQTYDDPVYINTFTKTKSALDQSKQEIS